MQIFSKGFVPDIGMKFSSLEPGATQCISKEPVYEWAAIDLSRDYPFSGLNLSATVILQQQEFVDAQ